MPDQPDQPDQPADLDAYFNRIHYDGPAEPTLAVLAALMRHHMAHIPFEAIDVMLGRGVSLDPQHLEAKMLQQHRGGYCYEQTGLLRRMLDAIGFDSIQNVGRVWLRADPETGPAGPASHTSLRVVADDRLWLVDVGFGGFMPIEPILWQLETSQATSWGTYGLTRTPNGFLLRVEHAGCWRPLYEILDLGWQPIDLVTGNHYVATHPDSQFRHQLRGALTLADERRTLANNEFRRTRPDGSHTEQTLDADGLAQVLADEFGLTPEPAWRPMLDCIAAGTSWSAEVRL